MQQVSSSLRALGVRHGIIAPGYPRTNHRVQVASVMSLVRKLDWLREFDPRLIVIDEAGGSRTTQPIRGSSVALAVAP